MSTYVRESIEHFPLSTMTVLQYKCIIFKCVAVRLITLGHVQGVST